MGTNILPKAILCRWSVGLAVIIILLFVLVPVLASLADVELGPGSAILMIDGAAMGVLGIGALATGFIGIIKSKERSILVFLALAVGLFALIAAAGMISEALSP